LKELYLNERDLPSREEEMRRMFLERIEAESINFKQWTANKLIEEKFAESIGAESYERTEQRKGYRDGHYNRYLQLTTC
jgi:hypothetical protein